MTEQFDPKFLESEKALEQKRTEIEAKNEALKTGIRRRVELSAEEREDAYMAGYEPLARELDELAGTHIREVERERAELGRRVHSNVGERFGEHLTSLVNVPDEKLSELMATAQRTGQDDLAQAIAETALQRDRFGIFEEWARTNPEKGEALGRLRSMPEPERLAVRTRARASLFKADLQALTPTHEDRERARRAGPTKEERERAERARAAEASRAAFFGRQATQRVGRRTV